MVCAAQQQILEVSLEQFQKQLRAKLEPAVPWDVTLGELLYLTENTIIPRLRKQRSNTCARASYVRTLLRNNKFININYVGLSDHHVHTFVGEFLIQIHFHVAQLIRTDEAVFIKMKHIECLDEFKTRQFQSAMYSDAFLRNDLYNFHNFLQYPGTEIVDIHARHINILPPRKGLALLGMLHRDDPFAHFDL